MKRPAFQFYPGDWRRDAKLRSCSIGARGLWADLLCVMHDGEPYGHLSVNGQPLSDSQAASMVGVTLTQYRKLLKEIEEAGVSSRTDGGVLYSRRMVKDEHNREARAKGGIKSLENPSVPRPKGRGEGPGEGYLPPPPSGGPSDHPLQSAVAVAPAGTETAPPPPPPAREAEPESPQLRRCRDSLPAEYREVFEQALRAHRNPAALAAELCAIADGIRGTPAPTWAHMGLALHDMALAGQPMSANLLRAFARRARDGAGELHEPPPRGNTIRGGAPSKVEAMTERSLKAVESWAGKTGQEDG